MGAKKHATIMPDASEDAALDAIVTADTMRIRGFIEFSWHLFGQAPIE